MVAAVAVETIGADSNKHSEIPVTYTFDGSGSTRRGKGSRAREGFIVQATGKGIYGYRYVPESKKRVIYQPEAQVVRSVFEASAGGDSCYAIATFLNQEGIPSFSGGLWHPLTIKRILTNPTFKGTTFFGRTKRIALGGNRRVEERPPEEWIEIPGATPAIVAESLFDIVQVALSKPNRNPNVSSRKYLLTSHIECDCSAPAVGTCLNQTYRYYRCRSTWPTSTRPRTCNACYIKADLKADLLQQEVWKAVTEVLEQPQVVAEELESQQGGLQLLEDKMARVSASVRRLADQEKRVIRLYGKGHVPEDYLKREAGLVRKAQETKRPRHLNCVSAESIFALWMAWATG